jgi:uncharacterized protein YgiM (DUF1202 family)
MRVLGLVVGWCCAGAWAAGAVAAEERQFPYTAYANSDDVYIRSGPGKNYYPTEKLSRGEAVEIYRHDPGGWYAVRPPQGSFSWVPARLLQPTTGHLATVNGDRVVSRVGSRFSDVRDVIQVRLDRGEEVEIVEIKSLTTGGQSEQWCKIAPPAGEFRWVFGKFVDEVAPAPDHRVADETERGSAARESNHAVRTVSAERPQRYYSEDIDPSPPDDGGPAEPLPAKSKTRNGGGTGQVALTSGSDRMGGSSRASKSSAAPQTDPFQAEIDSINLAVSAMVVEEPTVWSFDDLDKRAEAARDHAQNAVQRGKARLLLDRIAKFEDIKRRSDTIQQVTARTDRKNNQLINVADTRATIGLAQVEPTGNYDTSGRLINVVSQRPNAPPYAIVNSDRVVLAFVTPAPGVNLRPYVGQQVGVSGQRGFIPELNKPHITAQRINPLDEPPTAVASAHDQEQR